MVLKMMLVVVAVAVRLAEVGFLVVGIMGQVYG